MRQTLIPITNNRLMVHVDYVRWLESELAIINKSNLENIDFYENDELLNIPKEIIDRYKFIGLNNISFITTNYYKEGNSSQIRELYITHSEKED